MDLESEEDQQPERVMERIVCEINFLEYPGHFTDTHDECQSGHTWMVKPKAGNGGFRKKERIITHLFRLFPWRRG